MLLRFNLQFSLDDCLVCVIEDHPEDCSSQIFGLHFVEFRLSRRSSRPNNLSHFLGCL